jgi:hypothetical protein
MHFLDSLTIDIVYKGFRGVTKLLGHTHRRDRIPGVLHKDCIYRIPRLTRVYEVADTAPI